MPFRLELLTLEVGTVWGQRPRKTFFRPQRHPHWFSATVKTQTLRMPSYGSLPQDSSVVKRSTSRAGPASTSNLFILGSALPIFSKQSSYNKTKAQQYLLCFRESRSYGI